MLILITLTTFIRGYEWLVSSSNKKADRTQNPRRAAMTTSTDDDAFDHNAAVDTTTKEPPPPMKALLLFTRPESTLAVSHAVELAEVPRPLAAAAQSSSRNTTLIQIQAAAVTLEDLYTAIGRRPLLSITPTPTKPVIPGIDFTGIVSTCSSSNDKFQQGDVVMGCLLPLRVRHGGWAQYLDISSNNIIKVPSGWTRPQAAAFSMSALVAHAAVQIVNPETNNNNTYYYYLLLQM